jgi:hypothetical protein
MAGTAMRFLFTLLPKLTAESLTWMSSRMVWAPVLKGEERESQRSTAES